MNNPGGLCVTSYVVSSLVALIFTLPICPAGADRGQESWERIRKYYYLGGDGKPHRIDEPGTTIDRFTFLCGKIMQVLPEKNLLLLRSGNSITAVNVRDAAGFVDDDFWCGLSYQRGAYSYATVRGAGKRVRAYQLVEVDYPTFMQWRKAGFNFHEGGIEKSVKADSKKNMVHYDRVRRNYYFGSDGKPHHLDELGKGRDNYSFLKGRIIQVVTDENLLLLETGRDLYAVKVRDVSDCFDDDEWGGLVYPSGTYNYAAVSGADRTVRRLMYVGFDFATFLRWKKAGVQFKGMTVEIETREARTCPVCGGVGRVGLSAQAGRGQTCYKCGGSGKVIKVHRHWD